MTIKRKSRETNSRTFVGIDPGLIDANRNFITIDDNDMKSTKFHVELLVRHIIALMRWESPTFKYLCQDIFGGGSGYDGLKITKLNEFDIDILLRIPNITLKESNIPGYVWMRLDKFHELKMRNPEIYDEIQSFIDEKNYLLTKEMTSSFMQSIFDRVMSKIPTNSFRINNRIFIIKRIQSLGPAFTLTIQGPDEFLVSVDLVPCLVLDNTQWPENGFESNPCSTPSDFFFVVPKSPKRDCPHMDRYWRLSFQKQEREILLDRQRLKPTIRVLKRVRDKFGHKISSYAIKTMFLNALKRDNPTLDDDTPEMWSFPLSYCVVYMLEIYSAHLSRNQIPYFWNKKMNLLEDLTPSQASQYRENIESMLRDIKLNPVPATIIKYLR